MYFLQKMTNLMSKKKPTLDKSRQLIEVSSDEDADPPPSKAQTTTPLTSRKKPRSTSAFIHRGADFLRHPYRKRFLPLSRLTNRENNQDYQYRIDPKNCIWCQAGHKIEFSMQKNYNVMIHYAMETLVSHACPQRSNEKSKVGLVVLFVVSEEFPNGICRYYAPIVTDEHKKLGIQTFQELGKLQHCMLHFTTVV